MTVAVRCLFSTRRFGRHGQNTVPDVPGASHGGVAPCSADSGPRPTTARTRRDGVKPPFRCGPASAIVATPDQKGRLMSVIPERSNHLRPVDAESDAVL